MLFSKKDILNPSIINTGMVVGGNVVSDGELNIDGIVDGDVSAQIIVIGINGKVIGKVEAKEISVYGVIEGEIVSDSVFLSNTARVIGNIIHKEVELESGAFIEGDLRKK